MGLSSPEYRCSLSQLVPESRFAVNFSLAEHAVLILSLQAYHRNNSQR